MSVDRDGNSTQIKMHVSNRFSIKMIEDSKNDFEEQQRKLDILSRVDASKAVNLIQENKNKNINMSVPTIQTNVMTKGIDTINNPLEYIDSVMNRNSIRRKNKNSARISIENIQTNIAINKMRALSSVGGEHTNNLDFDQDWKKKVTRYSMNLQSDNNRISNSRNQFCRSNLRSLSHQLKEQSMLEKVDLM